MYAYWVVLASVVLLQIKFNKKTERNVNFILIMLILFLFAGLRGNGKGDYFNYLQYSTYIQSLSDVFWFDFPMEIGFRILAFVGNYLRLDSQFVIIAMNFISLSCIYKFLKWHSVDWCYSTILFIPIFLQFDMHAARSAVAISLCTIAYHYLLSDNLKKFFLFNLLAMCFHQSAIIFILSIFCKKIRIGLNFSIMLIVVVFLFTTVFDFDQIIIEILQMLGFQNYANGYRSYASSIEYGYAFSLFDPRFPMILAIFLFSKLSMDKSSLDEIVTSNLLLFNILLLLILRQHTSIALRMSAYFNIYTITAIPNAIRHIKGNDNKLYYKCIIGVLYIIFTGFLLIDNIPYKVFFM